MGMMCRDDVQCCSHLHGCFVFLGLVRKREERWEGRPRGRSMVCKVWKYRALLFTKNKQLLQVQTLSSEIVNPTRDFSTEVETVALAN